MSWSTGSVLMSEIIDTLKLHVHDEEIRQSIYKELIELFSVYDCDTLYECVENDEAFAAAYKEVADDFEEYYEEEE